VTGKWPGIYGEIDPLKAPYVISGVDFADGYNPGTVRIAWRRRRLGTPDLILLWCQKMDPWRYELTACTKNQYPIADREPTNPSMFRRLFDAREIAAIPHRGRPLALQSIPNCSKRRPPARSSGWRACQFASKPSLVALNPHPLARTPSTTTVSGGPFIIPLNERCRGC